MVNVATDTDLRTVLSSAESAVDPALLGYIRNQLRDLENVIRRADAERYKAEGQMVLAQAQKLQIVHYLRSLVVVKEPPDPLPPAPETPPKRGRRKQNAPPDRGTPTP